jgi:hypothetical protein
MCPSAALLQPDLYSGSLTETLTYKGWGSACIADVPGFNVAFEAYRLQFFDDGADALSPAEYYASFLLAHLKNLIKVCRACHMIPASMSPLHYPRRLSPECCFPDSS